MCSRVNTALLDQPNTTERQVVSMSATPMMMRIKVSFSIPKSQVIGRTDRSGVFGRALGA